MDNFNDDELKYKKKAKNKPPKKFNHKHVFQDCVFEWDNPHGTFKKEKGFIQKREIFGGSFCTICGRINYKTSFEWDICIKKKTGWCYTQLTDRAKSEINPETRTLPTFYLKDKWNQKFV